MTFEQYVKEYRKEMERLGIDETDITDGELMKMFLSHSVIRNWDNEQQKKEKKRIKKSFVEAWEGNHDHELMDKINKDVEKIQKEICPSCLKKIGLVESNDHDSLCKECYWGENNE